MKSPTNDIELFSLQKTWSSFSKEVVTKEEQERWASFLSLCAALPSCSTAPFISLQKLFSRQYPPSSIWSTLYCKCVKLWPCEALVSSLIPVCTLYPSVCTSGQFSYTRLYRPRVGFSDHGAAQRSDSCFSGWCKCELFTTDDTWQCFNECDQA